MDTRNTHNLTIIINYVWEAHLKFKKLLVSNIFVNPGLFLCAGLRGAELPGRGVPVGDELHESLPVVVQHQEKSVAIVGDYLYANCIETETAEAVRGAHFGLLHQPQHNHPATFGKLFCTGCLFRL